VFVLVLHWLYSSLGKTMGQYRRYENPQLGTLFPGAGLDISKIKFMDCAGGFFWYLIHVLLPSQCISSLMARIFDRWIVPIAPRGGGAGSLSLARTS